MSTKAYSFCILLLIFGKIAFSQNQVVEYRDLLYVDDLNIENDSLQRLNLSLPSTIDHYPLLVWIGGGAWSYGDRNLEMPFARKMAEKGIAVASVGHRLSPAVWRDPKLSSGIQHPKHIEDIASALRWLVSHASDYGFNPNYIFIGGYSSGAQLSMLIDLDKQYLKSKNLDPDLLKGVIAFSGTYDIEHYYQTFLNGNTPELAETHVKAVFGNQLKQASATEYLSNLKTPILLVSDNNVIAYTQLFAKVLEDKGFDSFKTEYATELTHGQLWRSLSFDDESKYRDLIIEFIFSNIQDNKKGL
jgi:hypothetical protein